MWVFGYGSLMWDGWETQYGCTRRVLADLPGYCRVFNKASIKNWGTKSKPCPTLNLAKVAGGACRGIAFAFPDSRREEVFASLEMREGRNFALREMLVRLVTDSEVSAFVPVYEGNNVIFRRAATEIVSLIHATEGEKGPCLAYVKGIADKLAELGINDEAVNEIWRAASASR